MTAWLPLESNPEVLNEYIYKLGVARNWNIVDVYGTEDEALEWIPKPVKAIILLFPCSATYEKYRTEEDEKLKVNPPETPADLFYTKQYISNACGTIALVHSFGNIPEIPIEDGILKNYLDKARYLTPEERGKILQEDTEFTDTHELLAQEGQTQVNIDEPVNHHFIAFIQKDGRLFEMDGRKSFPIDHGATTDESFLKDAVKVCKQFMDRDPDDIRYTILAVTPLQI